MTTREQIMEEVKGAVRIGWLTRKYGEELKNNTTVEECILRRTDAIMEILKKAGLEKP